MRSRHVVTALATVTAGLTAAAAWQRRTARRLPDSAAAPVAASAPTVPRATSGADPDGVVLPFIRRVAAPEAEHPATPARCGDSGGRTKAGAPCAARATTSGRCHHHRVAA
jgi:hypothetical protein